MHHFVIHLLNICKYYHGTKAYFVFISIFVRRLYICMYICMIPARSWCLVLCSHKYCCLGLTLALELMLGGAGQFVAVIAMVYTFLNKQFINCCALVLLPPSISVCSTCSHRPAVACVCLDFIYIFTSGFLLFLQAPDTVALWQQHEH